MLQRTIVTLLAGILCMPAVVSAEEDFPDVAKRIPHLTQRLRSTRWEARYCLLGELTGRDPETRRALETLVRDSNESVANQALVRYETGFLDIDRALFKPGLYWPHRFPLDDLPAEDPAAALVDYCLARRKIQPGNGRRDCTQPDIPVLDAARLEEPRMHEALTIVGILGKPEDANALAPFLQSPNDYVALGAARAVLRLGDKAKGLEALLRLTAQDPVQHLYYVTEALQVLKEMDYPELKAAARRVLSSVDRSKGIQPNWVSGFLLLAADVAGDEVWKD